MTNLWIPRSNVATPSFNDPNFGGSPIPRFQAVFQDLGAGVADLTVISQLTPAPAATYSRATTAYTRLASGIWAQVGVNTPRSYYGCVYGQPFTGRYDGYLHETVKTNGLLFSRDITNGSWNKFNCTVAKNQIGIDGVANSASSMIATASPGWITQGIGAGYGPVGVYIKRLAGSGTIQISRDSAANYEDVTALVASIPVGQWTPWPVYTVLGGASGTVFFKLGTIGDAVAVDMFQAEDILTSLLSTPIPTTNIIVSRLPDSLSYPLAGIFPTPTDFTISTTFAALFSKFSNINYPFMSRLDANNDMYIISTSTISMERNLAGAITQVSSPKTFTTGESIRATVRNSSISGMAAFVNGIQSPNSGSDPATIPFGTTFFIGTFTDLLTYGSFAQQNLCIYPSALSNEQIFEGA